jgi:hypothetical protein
LRLHFILADYTPSEGRSSEYNVLHDTMCTKVIRPFELAARQSECENAFEISAAFAGKNVHTKVIRPLEMRSMNSGCICSETRAAASTDDLMCTKVTPSFQLPSNRSCDSTLFDFSTNIPFLQHQSEQGGIGLYLKRHRTGEFTIQEIAPKSPAALCKRMRVK